MQVLLQTTYHEGANSYGRYTGNNPASEGYPILKDESELRDKECEGEGKRVSRWKSLAEGYG